MRHRTRNRERDDTVSERGSCKTFHFMAEFFSFVFVSQARGLRISQLECVAGTIVVRLRDRWSEGDTARRIELSGVNEQLTEYDGSEGEIYEHLMEEESVTHSRTMRLTGQGLMAGACQYKPSLVLVSSIA